MWYVARRIRCDAPGRQPPLFEHAAGCNGHQQREWRCCDGWLWEVTAVTAVIAFGARAADVARGARQLQAISELLQCYNATLPLSTYLHAELLHYYSLRTAHCALRTAHCSLLTTHCPLPTAHCSLLTAHCSLLTAHCSLLTAHC